MSLDLLLSRLNRVRRTGEGRWTACCPAHEDRSPSLAIRDNAGVILLHCFGGCPVDSIAAAVGLDLTDLFPPRPSSDENRAPRSGIHPADALRLIEHEARTVAELAVACTGAEGLLPDSISLRLARAAAAISAARAACSAN